MDLECYLEIHQGLSTLEKIFDHHILQFENDRKNS